MAYCRFSDINGLCDAYVYESEEGYVIHMAETRPVPPVMWNGFSLLTAAHGDIEAGSENDHPAIRLYLAQAKASYDEVRQIEKLDLPGAGETFTFDEPGKAAQKLWELATIGFIIPLQAIMELREDQEALDRG